MGIITRSIMLATTSLVLASAMSARAEAQGTPAGEGDAADPTEITVMARKRQESILKVPVVTAVVSGKTLATSGISDIQRLTTRVPGLMLGTASLAIGPQISLRGVGTSAQDAGIDQSVSLNLDGLSLAQGLAFKSGLFDVNQVEVLKGPQSLFYGKASTGGVISIRTNDPGSQVEVIGRVGYEAEAREKKIDLILSGPVSDKLGIRLAGQFQDMEGFFRNKAVGNPAQGGLTPRYKRIENTEAYMGRITVKWDPSSDFSARLKANITRDDVQGAAANSMFVSCPEGLTPVQPANVQFISPLEDCKLGRDFYIVDMDPAAYPGIRNNGVPFILTRQKFGTLELNWKPLAGLNLTSVTGYYNLKSDVFFNTASSGFAGPYFVTDNRFRRRDVTQEFRLDSDFSSPLNFTLGAFYQDAKVRMLLRRFVNNRFTPNPAAAGQNGGRTTGLHTVPIKTYSAFGQVRYEMVPDRFEVAAGVRYADEKRSDTLINLTPGANNATVPIGNPPSAKPSVHARNWSPELTLTYTPTDDLTIFGSLKKGYKSGGFSLTQLYAANFDNSFKDERVQGGEAGIKARLFDRTLQLNVATYYYKYQGLQVGANEFNPATGFVVARTLNAGGARTYGIDFDFNYRPPSIDGLSITGAINWLNGKFTALNNAPCTGGQTIAEGCNLLLNPTTNRFTAQNLDGLKLLRGPEWQIQGGFTYETAMNSNMNLRFGADYQWTSTFRASLSRLAAGRQKRYALVNANVAIEDAGKAWEIALITNNLANKIVTSNCSSSASAVNSIGAGIITGAATRGPAGRDEVSCVPRRGREVWLRLTVRPFGM